MTLGRMRVPARTTHQHERGSAGVRNSLKEIKVTGLVGLRPYKNSSRSGALDCRSQRMDRKARAELNRHYAPLGESRGECPQRESVRLIRGGSKQDNPLGPFATDKFVCVRAKSLLDRLRDEMFRLDAAPGVVPALALAREYGYQNLLPRPLCAALTQGLGD